jgi:hypothetical protein
MGCQILHCCSFSRYASCTVVLLSEWLHIVRRSIQHSVVTFDTVPAAAVSVKGPLSGVAMQACSVQARLQGRTFLPPKCTLFRRGVMAFERVLHVANGSNLETRPDHNLIVASRDVLSQTSAILADWGVSHELIHPLEANHRSRAALPHLLCTGKIPDKLRDQMCSLQDLQLLSCELGVRSGSLTPNPKVSRPSREHVRIVVAPDEWIVESIPAEDSEANQLNASSLTGFARLELVRLRTVCPEALLIRARCITRMQPSSSTIRQNQAVEAEDAHALPGNLNRSIRINAACD